MLTDNNKGVTNTGRGTPLQDAARFYCAYVFKEFADGTDGGWDRVGGGDPLIPSSAVAWPRMRDDFIKLVRKYWPATATAGDVATAFDRMLVQWKAAAKKVADAKHHAKASTAVVVHSADRDNADKTTLSCCGKELRIETSALAMLRERFDRYAPNLDDDDDRLDEYDDETFITVPTPLKCRFDIIPSICLCFGCYCINLSVEWSR